MPLIEGGRYFVSQCVQSAASVSMGHENWVCHCIPKGVYHIYVLTASIFILPMGH